MMLVDEMRVAPFHEIFFPSSGKFLRFFVGDCSVPKVPLFGKVFFHLNLNLAI